MTWIEMAHEVTGRQGVSAAYDLREGWLAPYPETSGYLIPTMLRAGDALERPALVERAREIGAWLTGLQDASGSFPGGVGIEGEPVAFDVGQIVLGLVKLHRREGDQALLDAAALGARWLVSQQEPSGAWRSHLGYPNTYCVRVSWAMAEVWHDTGDAAIHASVERSLGWALEQVTTDGWIDGMRFSPGHAAWTHTIGYALRGLLRAGVLVGGELGERSAAAAATCARGLGAMTGPLDPLLPGEIGPGFTALSDYACLTGDAQMATIWLDLAARGGDAELRSRAGNVVERLISLQVAQPLEPATVGAVAGSWPLTGGFEPLTFPNWAAKFHADAVLNLARAEGEEV